MNAVSPSLSVMNVENQSILIICIDMNRLIQCDRCKVNISFEQAFEKYEYMELKLPLLAFIHGFCIGCNQNHDQYTGLRLQCLESVYST